MELTTFSVYYIDATFSKAVNAKPKTQYTRTVMALHRDAALVLFARAMKRQLGAKRFKSVKVRAIVEAANEPNGLPF